MFEVALGFAGFIELGLLIRDAVAVGVAIGVDVLGVGLADEHAAIIQRLHLARQEQVIDEDGVLVVDAVAFGGFPAADAALGFHGFAAVDVEHVGAHLADVEHAIAVP